MRTLGRTALLVLGLVVSACGLFEDATQEPATQGTTPTTVATDQPQPQPPATPQGTAPQTQGDSGPGGQANQGIQIPGIPGLTLPNPFPMKNQGSGQPDGGASGSGTNIPIPGLPGISLPFPTSGDGQGGSGGGASKAPEVPSRGSLSPAPFGSFDGEGLMTSDFIMTRSRAIHATLIAALGERERNLMSSVPFEIANEANEPNAAAICSKSSRRPFILITTAMLVVAAGIAETKSYDEVSNTNYFDSYIDAVVNQVKSKRPVGAVPRGLLTGPQAIDQHKLARQVHLFDQELAFIIGHELAHHYRGHTGCVSSGGDGSRAQVSPEEISRILSSTIPVFHQPQEIESDMWGIVTLLEAGNGRQGGRWTEEGALLNMDFFGRLRDRGGEEIFTTFFSTHPLPQLRTPIIQSTARQWRPGWRPTTTPGVDDGGLRIPTPVGNLPIPIPIPQPASGGTSR